MILGYLLALALGAYSIRRRMEYAKLIKDYWIYGDGKDIRVEDVADHYATAMALVMFCVFSFLILEVVVWLFRALG